MQRVREAVVLHLDAMRHHGEPIPTQGSILEYVEVETPTVIP